MKIAHLSFSSSGGAGKVARELHLFQQANGFDSFFFNLTSTNLHMDPWSQPKLLTKSLFDKYLISKSNSPSMISILRNLHKGLNVNKVINNKFDIVHLHWLPGLIRLSDLEAMHSSKVKFIWSIQDFWPMTGGCHFSGKCEGFIHNCSKCPLVKSGFEVFIKKQHYEKKRILHKFKNNLFLVAPSKFVADKLKSSSIFSDFHVSVIGNPISIRDTNNIYRRNSINLATLNKSFTIGCVAADLSEKRKNISVLIEWFTSNSNKFNDQVKLLLIGNGGKYIGHHPKIEIVENVKTEEMMNNLYKKMDINLSISTEETFGYSVLEAGIQGVPSICIRGSAQSELIKNNINGYLLNSINDLTDKIHEIISSNTLHSKIASNVVTDFMENYATSIINKRYIEIYKSKFS
jgi:glycosyltransferase involved in cell wall biosynthesis